MELFINHLLKYWTIVFVDFHLQKHLFDTFDNHYMRLIGNCLIDFKYEKPTPIKMVFLDTLRCMTAELLWITTHLLMIILMLNMKYDVCWKMITIIYFIYS